MSKRSKKEKKLLLIVAALLILKFALMPIFEWQEEKNQTIQMGLKQHNKMTNLIAVKNEIEQTEQQLTSLLNTTKQIIPTVDSEKYKIDVQKKIADILAQQNIKIERSNWNNDLPGPLVTTLVFNMQISGRSHDIIATHFDIENAFNNAKIDDLQINVRRHLAKSLGTMRATYKINFLVQIENNETN